MAYWKVRYCYDHTRRWISSSAKDVDPLVGIRLNKCFGQTHSRREADALIQSGRVTVNGKLPTSPGVRVIHGKDSIQLDGENVEGWRWHDVSDDDSRSLANKKHPRFVYLKYWKPKGVICTTDRRVPNNIMDALLDQGKNVDRNSKPPPHRIFPVGRLDKDSHGLILLTSDGRVTNSVLGKSSTTMMKEENNKGIAMQPMGINKEKTYRVLLDRPITERHMNFLREGVMLTTKVSRVGQKDKLWTAKTKSCSIESIPSLPRTIEIILQEGRNRQIRAMLNLFHYKVLELQRTGFVGIGLDGLKNQGDWKYLDSTELRNLMDLVLHRKPHDRTQ